MEYQKTINLLGNTPNQTTKFRIKNWVKINDDERGTYNLMVKLNLKLQSENQVYVIVVMHIYL